MGNAIAITGILLGIGFFIGNIVFTILRTRIKGLKLSIYKIGETFTSLQQSQQKGNTTEIVIVYYYKNNGESAITKVISDLNVRTANNTFDNTYTREFPIKAGENENKSLVFKFPEEVMDWIDGTIKFTWKYFIKEKEKTKTKTFPITRT